MNRSNTTTALAAIALATALYAGARRVGPLPALGPFLDPVHGVWAVARRADLPRSASADVPGLSAPVHVLYDVRGVPHIFATTENDAARALGYVVARDRLVQLELQTLAATGRLTELGGPAALPLDREMRRLGLPRAAERKLAAMDTTSSAWQANVAFAQGVNAYIAGLTDADIPLEHRLLGRKPMRWDPINSIHLLNRMGWTLAYDDVELRHLRVAAMVGDSAADALLPVNSLIQEPIQPNGQRAPRFDHRPIAPPGAPDLAASHTAAEIALVLPQIVAPLSAAHAAGDALGSNNWAVAPRRTRDGHALLAGDPHLDLTLPSIWYEAHLVVPGTLDVYGVTIPGAPAIIIGFNRDVAWTFTNTQSDVLDFYAESVNVAARPTRYLLDGHWRPLERRAETYRGPHGELLATDTILFTHRGPLRHAGDRWLSMRWTVLDSTSDMGDFIGVSHAHSVDQWQASMRDYNAPAQNMLVADRAGTIAIRSTGRFPLRPGDGRGDVIRDGTTSRSDWTGFWPVERYPQVRNPRQGFLASANQQPIDPRVSATYLGADWFAPWRAIRINTLLRADSAVTSDAMRRFQTDPGSSRADFFVPYFLAAAAGTPHDTIAQRAARLLAQWDRRYTKDNTRAVLFEAAMSRLTRRLWDELIPVGDSVPVTAPDASVVAALLDEPTNVWWDDRRTTGVTETRDDVLRAALRDALEITTRRYGAPDGGGWSWSAIRHANIWHLLHLPALSRLALPVQGGPSTLSPSSGDGTEGASWRMVVEMSADVHAWGTYPGGQSGNPASTRYDDRLPHWLAGALDSLIFPRTSAELDGARQSAALTLLPAR